MLKHDPANPPPLSNRGPGRLLRGLLLLALVGCSAPSPADGPARGPLAVSLSVANPAALVGVPYLPVVAAAGVAASAERNPGLVGDQVLNVFSDASLTAAGQLHLTLRPIAEISSVSRDAGLLATLEAVAARCPVTTRNLEHAGFFPSYDASAGELFLFDAAVDPTLPGAEALGYITLSALSAGADTRLLLVGSRQPWSFTTDGPCPSATANHQTVLTLNVNRGWQLLRIVDTVTDAGVTISSWSIDTLANLDSALVAGLAYLDPQDAITEPVSLAFTVRNENAIEGAIFLPMVAVDEIAPSGVTLRALAEAPAALDIRNALVGGTLTANGAVTLTLQPVTAVRAPNGSALVAQILNEIMAVCRLTGVNVNRALLHPAYIFDPFEGSLLVVEEEGDSQDLNFFLNPKGAITLGSGDDDEALFLHLLVASDTAWSISTDGICSSGFGGAPNTLLVDMHAQPGWQLLRIDQQRNDVDGTNFVLSLEPLTLLAGDAPAGVVLDFSEIR